MLLSVNSFILNTSVLRINESTKSINCSPNKMCALLKKFVIFHKNKCSTKKKHTHANPNEIIAIFLFLYYLMVNVY